MYNILQLYNQDFNNIRIQTSTASHLKNSINLPTAEDISKSLSYLKSDDLLTDLNAIKISPIASLIKKLTGISAPKELIKSLVSDIQEVNNAGNPVTSIQFVEAFKELAANIQKDVSSSDFINFSKNSGIIKNDSSISSLIPNTIKSKFFRALSNASLENFSLKLVMNIETSDGNKIPSIKVPNLTYKDTELFELQRTRQGEHLFNSLLIKNNPAIVGTLTKLEVINKNRSKGYDKLTPEEQFTSDFVYDFLESVKNTGENLDNNKKFLFSVVLGNYSDKSTILAKIINGNFSVDGKTPIVKAPIVDILKTVRTQAANFYTDLIDKVSKDYKTLFDTLGISNNINTEASYNNRLKNIEEINNLLETNNLSKLKELYAENNAHTGDLELTEELHYSKYSNGTKMNDYIVSQFKVFNDETLFNTFVKEQEASFAHKASGLNVEFKASKYNKFFDLKEDSDKLIVDGELHPLVRK